MFWFLSPSKVIVFRKNSIIKIVFSEIQLKKRQPKKAVVIQLIII